LINDIKRQMLEKEEKITQITERLYMREELKADLWE
jgi:hypothetical protein